MVGDGYSIEHEGTQGKVSFNLHGPVEYSENVDGAIGNEVGYTVMTIEKNSNISFHLFTVFITNFREFTQELSFFIDAGNDFLGSNGVVLSNGAMGSNLYP